MFLTILNKTQRKAFWIIANAFVTADGNVDPLEKAMLDHMKHEMELEGVPLMKGKTLASHLSNFDSRPAQAAALLEILGLAHADADYSVKECEFVRFMAESFRISQKELAAMEDWVKRSCEVIAEAQSFMNMKEK